MSERAGAGLLVPARWFQSATCGAYAALPQRLVERVPQGPAAMSLARAAAGIAWRSNQGTGVARQKTTVMIQLGWARLKAEGPYPMRRGAWYRIVEAHLRDVVVQVHRQAVAIPRTYLDVSGTPPRRWTLVPRPANAPRLPESWGEWYLVCPSCHGRAQVHVASPTMRCPRCRVLFPVASDEQYLRDRGRDDRSDRPEPEPHGSTPHP